MSAAQSSASPCDGCTMCCKTMGVPSLHKAAGAWCDRCRVGVGCMTYESRPEECAGFMCMWALSQSKVNGARLPAELRPDRCKVVITPTDDGSALAFHVDPDRPEALHSGPVNALVDRIVNSGECVVAVIGQKRLLIAHEGNELLAKARAARMIWREKEHKP